MTTDPTQVLVQPEVAAFLEDVRTHLADLDADDRDELLGGLEADLSDQVADGAALGDPAAYAAELRAAGGFPERRRRLLPTVSPGAPTRWLDDARARFDRFVAQPRIAPLWEVVSSLRPVWWVARAWIAVTAVDVAAGPWEPISVLPSLEVPGLGLGLLVVAVVLSTLIGLGRLWPGSGGDRSTPRRVVLLALNGAAVVTPLLSFTIAAPGYLVGDPYDGFGGSGYSQGWRDAQREDRGIQLGNRPVHNIFAYDEQGRPLSGVQLVDQDGRPLAVSPSGSPVYDHPGKRTVACPAFNGNTPTYNVFPLAEVPLRRGTCEGADAGDAAEFPDPPLASLPPVTDRPGDGAPTDPGRTPQPRDR